MRNPRLSLLVAGAATILTGALAAPSAYAMREAHYLAKFDGKVHVEWNEPRHMTYRDCYRTWWHQGNGSEDWHVWSTGENLVRVTANGSGTPQIGYGVQKAVDETPDTGLKGKGTRNRSFSEATTFTAGSCGTLQEPMMDPPKPTDCGMRMINYSIDLSNKGTEIAPDVLLHDNPIREKLGYDNCRLPTPENYLEGTWPPGTGRLKYRNKPVTSFFGRERTLTATGKFETSGRRELQWGGVMTGTVTMKWTLTLTRVKVTKPSRSGDNG